MRRIIAVSLLVALAAGAAFAWHWPTPEKPDDRLVAERLHAALRAAATPDRLRDEAARALDRDRPEEAEGYLALADALGHPLPAGLLARYEEAVGTGAAVVRTVARGARGFLLGEVEDAAGLAGSTLADFTLYGDLRDLGIQARNLAAGAEVDEFVLGLSMVGLGLSAATAASGGTAAPAKAGVSLVKAAKRAGRLTAGMEGALRRTVAGSLDLPALRRRLAAADWRSPGKAMAEARAYAATLDLARPRALLGRFGAIAGQTSPGGALRILRHVDSAEDLARAERVATRYGKASPAVFQTLGKGTFKAFATVTRFAAEALWALATALASLAITVLSLLWSALSAARRLRRALAPLPAKA